MRTTVKQSDESVKPLTVEKPAKVNGSVHAPSKANILLVDDRSDKLLAIEAILAPLEQNLVTARSGKEALRHLLRQDFAVILLDVAMPGMDGFETAAMIRKRPRSEHTPIIFVTSISNSENNIFQGYSLGAVDYMITPITPEVLRTKVSVFVELHRKTELIRHQADQLRRIEEARHQRELGEAVDRLEAETKRNRFFTLAIDLLGIADFNGCFLQINPSWEKVLGYSEAELREKPGLEFAHPEDRPAMTAQFEKLKRDNFPVYYEGRYQCKDGSYCWLGWTAAPFASEQLIYIFARDITARKANEQEIKSLNSELNRRINDLTEVNKELESFNYSISHDLRAPLRSIASFTQVVLTQYDDVLPAEGQDYLRRVENAAKYMDKLLMDLLDYSRLSRSEMELVPVNLEGAVSDVLFSIDQEIRSCNAEIEIVRPLGSVIGHPATVRQILFNLIVNAMKFVGPDKVPVVRIWAEPADGFQRVMIQDNGIGIPTQFHRKIFGLFQRLHSHHAYPGTGVGLAMVQKGVERMAGRIGVDSEQGKGSRFWFLLRASNDTSDEQLDFTTEVHKTLA
jgi:PAS domain S-box-containing protein